MAETKKGLGDDFGIENTVSVDDSGVGNADLLADLLADEEDAAVASASPEGVSSIESEEDSSEEQKENESEKDKTPDPSFLSDFLSESEETEEEKEEKEDSTNASEKKEETNTTSSKKESLKPDSEKDPESTVIAFDSLANELADLGVFSRKEGEEELTVNSPEEFLERFKQEKQQAAQQIVSDFIGQFGQDYQEAFNAIYVNGVDPKTYFSKSSGISDFASMDLANEKNQEEVVRTMLTEQGYESEDVESELEKLKNYGDLEDASKRYHKVLVKKQKASLDVEMQRSQQEQQIKAAQKQEYLNNIQNVLQDKLKQKEFDGIPLNSNSANELQDYLLVDKWKTQSGETLTDFDKTILDLKKPENHEQKVKVALLLKLLEKDPTLSTIQKSGVSKKSSQLFKDVARQKTAADKQTSANNRNTAKRWFQ